MGSPIFSLYALMGVSPEHTQIVVKLIKVGAFCNKTRLFLKIKVCYFFQNVEC